MKAVLDESQPIFQQIAQLIMDEIVDGNLDEEDRVPSENELSAFYNINRATVRKGYQFLVDKEIIYKRRGLGMFVKAGASSKLRKERELRYMEDHVRPLLQEAKRIGISVESVIDMIKKEARNDPGTKRDVRIRQDAGSQKHLAG